MADLTTALEAAEDAQDAADGKIEVFYSNDAPSGVNEKEGDLWFDLDDGNKLYRYSSSAWTLARDVGIAAAVQAAADADSKADGKVTTFFAASTSAPTALSCRGSLVEPPIRTNSTEPPLRATIKLRLANGN